MSFEDRLHDAINGLLGKEEIDCLLDELHQFELDGNTVSNTVDALWDKLSAQLMDKWEYYN